MLYNIHMENTHTQNSTQNVINTQEIKVIQETNKKKIKVKNSNIKQINVFIK